VRQQAVEQGLGGWRIDAMEIVKHEDQRLGEVVEFVAQEGSDDGKRRQALGGEAGERLAAGVGQCAAHGSNEAADEGLRLAVAGVERQPRGAAGAALKPVRDERCLAVAKRCRNHGQRHRAGVFKAAVQFVTRNEIGNDAGDAAVCCEETGEKALSTCIGTVSNHPWRSVKGRMILQRQPSCADDAAATGAGRAVRRAQTSVQSADPCLARSCCSHCWKASRTGGSRA
jgi:hypothetical protein